MFPIVLVAQHEEVGAVPGGVGGVGSARLVSGALLGVTVTDPVVFVAMPVLLTVVACLACYLLARRALRVDPLVALRQE